MDYNLILDYIHQDLNQQDKVESSMADYLKICIL